MYAALYYPVLRSKPGEMLALKELSARAESRMRPVFELVRPSPQDRVEVLQNAAMQSILEAWGRRLPFYVDLRRYDPKRLTAKREQPIEHLFQCAEQLKLNALPVVGLLGTRSPEYFDTARRVAAARKGIALRLFPDDFATPRIKEKIEETLGVIALNTERIELFIDIGSRSRTLQFAKSDQQLLRIAQHAVSAVLDREFQSIILCGTSVPEHVGSKYNSEPFCTNRVELDIWSRIAAAMPQPVRFGDYGVITPHQPDGGGASRPPSRVRLATEKEILSFRVERTPNSYKELCSVVASEEAFKRQVASWGKSMIATSAVVRIKLGPSDMVAHDTNMHLETTCSFIEKHFQSMKTYRELEFAEIERRPEQSDAFLASP